MNEKISDFVGWNGVDLIANELIGFVKTHIITLLVLACTNQHKLKQLQSVNIFMLCDFIPISPLLSHSFLAPQVAMCAVCVVSYLMFLLLFS